MARFLNEAFEALPRLAVFFEWYIPAAVGLYWIVKRMEDKADKDNGVNL